MTMIISQIGLKPDALRGQTVLVTGAGGGIGYEAARSLLWLGANVVIAEIDEARGTRAAETLGKEFGAGRVLFVKTDVGDETSVRESYAESIRRFGKVDVVLNNATIAVLGKVVDVPIEEWDKSYRVNLRGPVLMARAFLPDMLKRKLGVFACVSSKGTAFLGGYETLKAAQLHLGDTLDAELEGTGVFAFTIGPGLVPTETAAEAVAQLAPLMGMSVDAFFEMNKAAVLSVEEAGAGFAASIVFAERFHGQEISSIQALKPADINFGAGKLEDALAATNPVTESVESREQALALCERVRTTLAEQSQGWKHRPLFERQWVVRDFRKTAGMPVEEWLVTLESLEAGLRHGSSEPCPDLEKLAGYYEHLADLAKGYERDPVKLQENLRVVYGWRDEVVGLAKVI